MDSRSLTPHEAGYCNRGDIAFCCSNYRFCSSGCNCKGKQVLSKRALKEFNTVQNIDGKTTVQTLPLNDDSEQLETEGLWVQNKYLLYSTWKMKSTRLLTGILFFFSKDLVCRCKWILHFMNWIHICTSSSLDFKDYSNLHSKNDGYDDIFNAFEM